MSKMTCTIKHNNTDSLVRTSVSFIQNVAQIQFDKTLTAQLQCQFHVINRIHAVGRKQLLQRNTLKFTGLLFPLQNDYVTSLIVDVFILTTNIVEYDCYYQPVVEPTKLRFIPLTHRLSNPIKLSIIFNTTLIPITINSLSRLMYVTIVDNIAHIKTQDTYNGITNNGNEWITFDRNELQNKTNNKYLFNYLSITLPQTTTQIKHYDTTGNISNLEVISLYNKKIARLFGRYPLLGGWKESYSFDYTFHIQILNNTISFPLLPNIQGVGINNVTIEIKFPIGYTSSFIEPEHIQHSIFHKKLFYYFDQTIHSFTFNNIFPYYTNESCTLFLNKQMLCYFQQLLLLDY
ncbi:Dolichyl-diphosphooligosaccharide--protein glycosyltransferase subunit 1 [Entamoeba marina]